MVETGHSDPLFMQLLKKEIADIHFRTELEKLLMDILFIDSSPRQGLPALKEAEKKIFDSVSQYLRGFSCLGGEEVKHPVSDRIGEHKYYTKLSRSGDSEEIEPSEAYCGRYNLLYLVENESDSEGRNAGLNAHIDVVNPYFPPSRENDYIRGRGSIDDKGGIAVILGSLKIIDILANRRNIDLKNNIAAMFVIDEEMGGNGSLSVAMDHELKRKYYDSLLILECAGNKIYTGNRGAIFIKIQGEVEPYSKVSSLTPMIESYAFGICGIINEGLKIKKESKHPAFPQNPVYTCTGILGPFGKHPSGICDYIDFDIAGVGPQELLPVEETILRGLEEYIGIFGDKRGVRDSLSGEVKIAEHYRIRQLEPERLRISVFGSGGHMGSLPENDAAITKWAFIAKELVRYKLKNRLSYLLEFSPGEIGNGISFEGAQSFLPCHKMEDVRNRLEIAFRQAVSEYQAGFSGNSQEINWTVSFNKLHNEAFAVDAESESVKNAVASGIDAGLIEPDDSLSGWDASCDARLFALEYPGLPVITAGPGELNGAHSDKEALFLPDLYDSILFTVLYLLRETNSNLS